VKGGKMTGE